jgi:hypothetical protein
MNRCCRHLPSPFVMPSGVVAAGVCGVRAASSYWWWYTNH